MAARAPLITAVAGSRRERCARSRPRMPRALSGVLRQRRARAAGALQHAGRRARAPRCGATRDGRSERAGHDARRTAAFSTTSSLVARANASAAGRATASRCRSSAAGSCISVTKSPPKSSRASAAARGRCRYSAFALRVTRASFTSSRPARSTRSRRMATSAAHDAAHRRSAGGAPAAGRSRRRPPLALESLEEEAPRAVPRARARARRNTSRAGDIYQANLSRPWRLALRDPADAAQRLRARCAAPIPRRSPPACSCAA